MHFNKLEVKNKVISLSAEVLMCNSYCVTFISPFCGIVNVV